MRTRRWFERERLSRHRPHPEAQAKKRVLVGTLTADLAGCRAGQAATVWQARKGKDRRIDRARTSASGVFKTKLRRRTGKFYAKVSASAVAGVADCTAAKSRKVTVRRR